MLALTLPALWAGHGNLTSDESLYLSEAYNIATGKGPTYASGDLINHRPPLYPLLLSVPLSVTNGEVASAYWIPALVSVALVGATFLLASQLFGLRAGVIAALLVACSSYLRWLGTTLFLDGTETLFLLLALVALWKGFQGQELGWFVAVGALLGCGFWVKEAAIQWLPLPLVFLLFSSGYRSGRIWRGLAAYGATAGALLGAWWLWVYVGTGRIYFWGGIDTGLLLLACAIAVSSVLFTLAVIVCARSAPKHLPLLGAVLVVTWSVSAFVALERAGWSYPHDFWRTVPDYVWRIVAPNSQPWPLIAAGVAWLCWRWTKDPGARLLLLGMALYLPFALHAANRSLSYRDLLPIVYVLYVAAGAAAAAALGWAEARVGVVAVGGAAAAVVVLGLTQTTELVDARLPNDPVAVTQANWDNSLVHATARWMHGNIPPGERVMSSRLYHSQLYVLDGAAHPISQLPTVLVEPRPGEAPSLARSSTLFRWEDHRLGERHNDERWLYVQRYPSKGYYIALSEHDLLRELDARSINYLIITGEDAGFSSFAYLDYFVENPAFSLVHTDFRSPHNAAFVFAVDRDRLAFQLYQAALGQETFDSLAAEFGGEPTDVATAIDPDGVVVRGEDGREFTYGE